MAAVDAAESRGDTDSSSEEEEEEEDEKMLKSHQCRICGKVGDKGIPMLLPQRDKLREWIRKYLSVETIQDWITFHAQCQKTQRLNFPVPKNADAVDPLAVQPAPVQPAPVQPAPVQPVPVQPPHVNGDAAKSKQPEQPSPVQGEQPDAEKAVKSKQPEKPAAVQPEQHSSAKYKKPEKPREQPCSEKSKQSEQPSSDKFEQPSSAKHKQAPVEKPTATPDSSDNEVVSNSEDEMSPPKQQVASDSDSPVVKRTNRNRIISSSEEDSPNKSKPIKNVNLSLTARTRLNKRPVSPDETVPSKKFAGDLRLSGPVIQLKRLELDVNSSPIILSPSSSSSTIAAPSPAIMRRPTSSTKKRKRRSWSNKSSSGESESSGPATTNNAARPAENTSLLRGSNFSHPSAVAPPTTVPVAPPTAVISPVISQPSPVHNAPRMAGSPSTNNNGPQILNSFSLAQPTVQPPVRHFIVTTNQFQEPTVHQVIAPSQVRNQQQATVATTQLAQNQQQMRPVVQATVPTTQLAPNQQQARPVPQATVPTTQLAPNKQQTRPVAQAAVSTSQLAQNETRPATQNQQPTRPVSQTTQNQQPAQVTNVSARDQATPSKSIKNVDYETALSIRNHPKFNILTAEHKAKVMEVLANPPKVSQQSPEVIDLDDDDPPPTTVPSLTSKELIYLGQTSAVQKPAEVQQPNLSDSSKNPTEYTSALKALKSLAESSIRDHIAETPEKSPETAVRPAEAAVRPAATVPAEVAPTKEPEFLQPPPPKPAKENALMYQQSIPNYIQNVQNHPQNAHDQALMYSHNVSNYNQNAQSHQRPPQNALMYPQNVSNHPQNAHSHQNHPQNALMYSPNVSNYNQNAPSHQRPPQNALTYPLSTNPTSLPPHQSTATLHTADPPTRINLPAASESSIEAVANSSQNIWSIVESIIEEETLREANSTRHGLVEKLVTEKLAHDNGETLQKSSHQGLTEFIDKLGHNVLIEPVSPEVNNNQAEISITPIEPISPEVNNNQSEISITPIEPVTEPLKQKRRRHQSENSLNHEFESVSHLTIPDEAATSHQSVDHHDEPAKKSRKRHQSEKSSKKAKEIASRRSSSDAHVAYTSRRQSVEEKLPDMPLLNGDDPRDANDDDQENNLSSMFETQEMTIQCVKCDQYFTDYNELLAHHEVHTQSEMSSQELSNSQILEDIKNTLSRTEVEDYSCSYCRKVFGNPSEMEGHISTSHLGVNIYQCIHCPNRFSTKNRLNKHMMQKHTGKYSYDCNNCDKIFMTKLELLRHNSQNHPMPKKPLYHCTVCQKAFKTHTGVEKHREKEHGIVSENIPVLANTISDQAMRNVFDMVNPQQGPVCCKHCTGEFNTVEELKSHCRKAHKHLTRNKTVSCNFCSEKFKTKEDLDKHCKKTHKNVSVFAIVKPNKHTISCKYCSDKFKDTEELYVHCKRIHRQLWFCNECRFSASKETQLKTHKLKHESSRLAEEFQKSMEEREKECSFPCPYCNLDFVDDDQRAAHSNEAHAQDLPYPCDVCPMRHTTEELYNLHAFSHEPPKSAPSCNICDKTFSKTSLLQDHMKWHDDCQG
ncbi:hypothetical protein B566_EDAN013970 [Ephemera danica]|nr:hypothetical protein B566_EDAN013970 [Ephemera danica]